MTDIGAIAQARADTAQARCIGRGFRQKTMIWKPAGLSLATAACLVALSATEVWSACRMWNVSGSWHARQTNGYNPKFVLRQSGSDVQGSASYPGPSNTSCRETATCPVVKGSVDGTMSGDAFMVNVYWNNGTVGVYQGNVGPQGRINGETFDRRNKRSKADWYSSKTVHCRWRR